MIGLFFRQKIAHTTDARRTSGLHLLPEGIQFFAFGVDLLFGELRDVIAVNFGFGAADGIAGGRGFFRDRAGCRNDS